MHLPGRHSTRAAFNEDSDVREALPSQPRTPACNGRREEQEGQGERYIGPDHLRTQAQGIVLLFDEVADGKRTENRPDGEKGTSEREPQFAGTHNAYVTQCRTRGQDPEGVSWPDEDVKA